MLDMDHVDDKKTLETFKQEVSVSIYLLFIFLNFIFLYFLNLYRWPRFERRGMKI